jgi:predicted dehydrogenase
MKPLRIGAIGSGYWGPNLIRNFVELADSELIAVADLNEARLAYIKERYPTVQVTRNYRDLFSLKLDAVVVATPPATHYQLVSDCLEHDLNVLVEKPITLNSAHAEELVHLADARGLKLMVGHTFEYNTAVEMLRRLIESGELGQIYYIDTVRVNLGLFQRDLNVLWDLAPHDISILLYLLGETSLSVSAQGTSCVLDGVQDVAYLNLTFANNILAHVRVSWLDPSKTRRITIVGSKKMVIYDDVETIEKIKIYDKGVKPPPYTDNFGEFQFGYRHGDVVIPHIHFVEPLRQECQHFLDSIKHNRTPRSDGRVGLNVVRVLEAAQRSLKNGGASQDVILDKQGALCLAMGQ